MYEILVTMYKCYQPSPDGLITMPLYVMLCKIKGGCPHLQYINDDKSKYATLNAARQTMLFETPMSSFISNVSQGKEVILTLSLVGGLSGRK